MTATRTRRSGEDTRAEAQRLALSLFITQGYEATSLREIAEGLGISKAALYYHFASKEDIVRSLFADRGTEAADLLAWAKGQDPGPDLARQTVLRWIDSVSIDKLRGIRFMNANPRVSRAFASSGADIGSALEEIAARAAGADAGPTRLLLVRMALLSINHAVAAADGTSVSDEDIITAARAAATALLAPQAGS